MPTVLFREQLQLLQDIALFADNLVPKMVVLRLQ